MTEARADASATKAFFVDMLVRDISVDAAILDLIDNAVDAAYRHSGGTNDFSTYHVKVIANPDQFSITDDCGGISIADAQDNVFRFGRPPGYEPATRIGQFGIGLKRAVFRLGRQFKVDSSTTERRFTVEVDVADWGKNSSDWTFPMRILGAPTDSAGTTVTVEDLHMSVRQQFERDGYAHGMLQEIAVRYEPVLAGGLSITLNGQAPDMREHALLQGTGVTPEHFEENIEVEGQKVHLRIVAGIGPKRQPRMSGWYVYCNGRLVLKADRTSLTGWGTADVDGKSGIPAWHNQYGRFYGFVFFDSDYPAALPWATTKTEIDESNEAYRFARRKMQNIIRSFATYTNAEKQELEDFEASDGSVPKTIAEALDSADFISITNIAMEPPSKFSVPRRSASALIGQRMANIQFKAEEERVEKLKQALDVRTNRQIGEIAFAQLYQEEIGSE